MFKHIKIKFAFLFFSAALLFGQTMDTVYYAPSDQNIFNPERGFSTYLDSPVSLSLCNSLKAQKLSLIQRIYTIPQYRDKALPQSFLDLMQKDLNTAREGGVKLIIRFSYTDDQNGADAALDTILMHIEQIKPILQKNYDVIAYMEAGFIGAWGEWYYSSHHLNNTNDRRTVLFALLDALPVERDVVVRTPNYKRLIFNDNTPINDSTAFNGSKKSRTGAHNDCFLASATDYGTYLENDIQGDKDYLHQDNLYVPQGGETCSPSAYSGCTNALKDLAYMRWSALNKDYNEDVLAGWESGGCMSEIKKRLGYRFVLLNAVLPDSIKPGGTFAMDFTVYNHGFANPYNPRLVEVILRNTQDQSTYRLETNADPRFWHPEDTVQVHIEGGIPADLPEGSYQILLHLADPVEALRYRPEYAIQLANENIWEEETGFNNLQHEVMISTKASGQNYTGSDFFEFFQLNPPPPPPQGSNIIIDGHFEDWQNVPRLDTGADVETSGDALNADVDLTALWMTNDSDNVYISYQVQGSIKSNYFYHVFFDTDNDPTTGFHSANSYMGIDYMVENGSLWKYSGTNGGWGWTYVGSAVMAQGTTETGRIEMAVAKSDLGLSDTTSVLPVIFNINDLDDNHDDDYAPNAYQDHSYNYKLMVTGMPIAVHPNVPRGFGLRAFPNPFNSAVQIHFNPVKTSHVKAKIYDLNGRVVRAYHLAPGQNAVIWRGTTDGQKVVSSGLYVFEIKNKKQVQQIKLMFLK